MPACDASEEYVLIPQLMLRRVDYDYIVGAIVERAGTWDAFVQEALIEAAAR